MSNDEEFDVRKHPWFKHDIFQIAIDTAPFRDDDTALARYFKWMIEQWIKPDNPPPPKEFFGDKWEMVHQLFEDPDYPNRLVWLEVQRQKRIDAAAAANRMKRWRKSHSDN